MQTVRVIQRAHVEHRAVLTMLAIAIGFTPWLITCICMLILASIVKIYASYKMLEKEGIKITQLDNNMNTFIRDMLISVAIGAACLISMIFFPAFGAIACYVTIAAGITAAVIELVEGAVNIWKIWKLGSTVTDEEAAWLNATAAEANSN
jgi:hypothetical protein